MLDRTAWATWFEAAVSVVGLALLWGYGFRPRARAGAHSNQLPEWTATPVDLLTLLFFAVSFWFIAGYGSALAVRSAPLSEDHKIIVQSTVSELGLLGGVVAFVLAYPGRFQASRIEVRKTVVSGIATFFIAMPVVFVAGAVWTALLARVGLPVEKQSAIELFGRTKEFPWLIELIVLAIALAPIAEELIFRVVLFRYCRTRIPRWLAFLGPACLFAAMHQNLASFGQLVTLAVVFSYAYERTGQIGTSMVAHALFNLNTIVLLLLGINL